MARPFEVLYYVTDDPEHGWLPHIVVTYEGKDHAAHHVLLAADDYRTAANIASASAVAEAKRKRAQGVRQATPEEIRSHTW